MTDRQTDRQTDSRLTDGTWTVVGDDAELYVAHDYTQTDTDTHNDRQTDRQTDRQQVDW